MRVIDGRASTFTKEQQADIDMLNKLCRMTPEGYLVTIKQRVLEGFVYEDAMENED